MKIFLSLILLTFLFSCSSETQPIKYGVDDCTFCKMKIMDKHFGAEYITKKGKTYKFDAIECMIGFLRKNENIHTEAQNFLVIDYSKPENLIDAKTATWVYSEKLNSPMGGNTAAFTNLKDAGELQQQMNGTILNWNQVQEKIAEMFLVE